MEADFGDPVYGLKGDPVYSSVAPFNGYMSLIFHHHFSIEIHQKAEKLQQMHHLALGSSLSAGLLRIEGAGGFPNCNMGYTPLNWTESEKKFHTFEALVASGGLLKGLMGAETGGPLVAG